MIMEQSDFHCLGCGACSSICPRECIETKQNLKGFFSVHINTDKCVNCKLCESVCPIINGSEYTWNPKAIYYGKHYDNSIVMNSSSGGAFTAFAQKILQQEGVVYGVTFDVINKMAKYVAVKSLEELSNICKSKYVQAYAGKIFLDIKKDLMVGRKVVFSGTPCSVHGLKKFLNKNYENLYTIDFVCHGTPSPMVLKDYLIALEQEYCSKVTNIDFRPKTYGWSNHSLKIQFENGVVQDKRMMSDAFFKAFMTDNMILNDSCYACPYINGHISDITLADFWGYKAVIEDTNEEGLSLVFCNTEKGMELFETCNELVMTPISRDKLSYIFNKKSYPEECYERQKKFFSDYKGAKIEKIIERYTRTPKYIVMIKSILNWLRRSR